MAQKKKLRWAGKRMAVAVATCFAGPVFAQALPVNPSVVAGNATFAQSGNVLNITNANGTIINWQQFNIGAGYTVNFLQSSASSTVLNRVVSQDPSVILGSLNSNGRVLLFNSNGILIGKGAQIDVAGFIASTLNITDANFLAGKYLFDANSNAGSLVNQGTITSSTGGSVYLIAPELRNEGVINAPNGEVLLAAGQSVQLVDTATPGVKVEITGTEGKVTNLGVVLAEAGRIGMAGVLVRNSGTLNASSVVSEGGRVFLKASQDAYVDGSGRIVTTGTKGGQVEVLGNKVAVTDTALIDASGSTGGGSVLVGGDYQGKNAAIQNATSTYFGSGATIKADAINYGNGGKVVLWSDDTTQAYGNISAKGGSLWGDGGFVETSGHNRLVALGARVNASAVNGKSGQWLLDPGEIQILHGSTATATPSSYSASGTGTDTIYDSDISTALGYGTSVLLSTNVAGSGSGNIYFSPGVGGLEISSSSSTQTSLTLQAAGNISNLSGTFSATGSGGFKLILDAAGQITTASGNTLTLNGSASTMLVQVAGGKTWNNYGTINLTGASAIDLDYLGTGASVATFNNLSSGLVNVNSTSGWAFQSNSQYQNGVVNNYGTIDVQHATAFEAAYNQGSTGVLKLTDNGAGVTLGLQNAQSISGEINLRNGTYATSLFVNENHGTDATFSNVNFSGNGGTLYIAGHVGTVAASFSNVTGANTQLNVGSGSGNGAIDILGNTTFKNVSFYQDGYVGTFRTLSNATLGVSGGGLTIPDIDTVTGNVGLVTYGSLIFSSGANIQAPGNIRLIAGWDGTSPLTSPTLGSNVGSIILQDALVQAGGNVTLQTNGNLNINYYSSQTSWSLPTAYSSLVSETNVGSALVAGGNMSATIGGDLQLYNENSAYDQVSGSGIAGRFVGLLAQGTQTINMTGASSSIKLDAQYNNATFGGAVFLASVGNQSISFGAGTHDLSVKGGSGDSSGQRAKVVTKGIQTIDGTTAGGTLAITVTGGSPSISQNQWYATDGDDNVVCVGCVADAEASIRSDSWASTAQTIKASSLTLQGGGSSNGNGAYVEAHGGQNITITGNVTITGGSSGGAYKPTYYGGTFVNGTWTSNSYYGASVATGMEGYLSNEAGIGSDTRVTLSANDVSLVGGNAAYAGAYIGGPIININASGNVTLTAGAAVNYGGGVNLTPGALPTDFYWQNPAAIGWDMATNVTINAAGAITLSGGSAWTTTGSLAMIGSIKDKYADVTLSGSSINMSGTSDYSARIGSYGGDVSITATSGNIALGNALIITHRELGTGSVTLNAAGNISQGTSGFIGTADLSATAADIDLEGSNHVGYLTAEATSGNVVFYGDTVDLYSVEAVNGGVTIKTDYAIHETDVGTNDIKAGSGGITLISTYGGDADGLAISADVESEGKVTAIVNSGGYADTYGGIRIGITANPIASTNFELTDNASHNQSVSLYDYAGSLNLATNSALISVGSSGDVFIGAANNLTLGQMTYSTSGSVLVSAGGTLSMPGGYLKNLGGDVSFAVGALDMSGGGAIEAQGGLVGVVRGNATMGASATITTHDDDLNLVVGGNLTMSDNAYLYSGYSPSAAQTPDISVLVGGDLILNNGAQIKSINDVYLDLAGATSTLYLNQVSGRNASYVWSDIGMQNTETTHISFVNRTSGGIVIDGVSGGATVANGSGFFSGGLKSVASAGNGLDIAYATVKDSGNTATIVASIVDQASKTASNSSQVSSTQTNNNAIVLSSSATTTGTTTSSSTIGGDTSDSFGGSESSGNNSSNSSGNGTGTSAGKKNEKPVKKQCS